MLARVLAFRVSLVSRAFGLRCQADPTSTVFGAVFSGLDTLADYLFSVEPNSVLRVPGAPGPHTGDVTESSIFPLDGARAV